MKSSCQKPNVHDKVHGSRKVHISMNFVHDLATLEIIALMFVFSVPPIQSIVGVRLLEFGLR